MWYINKDTSIARYFFEDNAQEHAEFARLFGAKVRAFGSHNVKIYVAWNYGRDWKAFGDGISAMLILQAVADVVRHRTSSIVLSKKEKSLILEIIRFIKCIDVFRKINVNISLN